MYYNLTSFPPLSLAQTTATHSHVRMEEHVAVTQTATTALVLMDTQGDTVKQVKLKHVASSPGSRSCPTLESLVLFLM